MSSCSFSRKYKAFSVNRSVVQGLHPRLKSVFFPQYSYEAATLGSGSSQHVAGGGGVAHPAAIAPSTKAAGLRRGVATDRQMSQTVLWFHRYRIPAKVFCSHASANKYVATYGSQLPKSAVRMLKGRQLSKSVLKLWQLLVKLGLSPLATQVAVGVSEWKLGTAVDMLCRDASGNTVVIEVKTGFDTYYHKHTRHPMQHLQHVDDSPANQHQLQLFVTMEMYKRSQRVVGGLKGLIFRVHTTGIDVIPLQGWVMQQAHCILSHVSQTQPRGSA